MDSKLGRLDWCGTRPNARLSFFDWPNRCEMHDPSAELRVPGAEDPVVIVEQESRGLGRMLGHMLHKSDNLYAECILHAAAAPRGIHDRYQGGGGSLSTSLVLHRVVPYRDALYFSFIAWFHIEMRTMQRNTPRIVLYCACTCARPSSSHAGF